MELDRTYVSTIDAEGNWNAEGSADRRELFAYPVAVSPENRKGVAIVDPQQQGAPGLSVVYRHQGRNVLAECVVENGDWFYRTRDGQLLQASALAEQGATYAGVAVHIVHDSSPNRAVAK